jgi:ankyrin repeat protein
MRASKTALFNAAKQWDAPTVAALLKQAPELVHATDPKGRTALHIACGVERGRLNLGEEHGLGTVTALLKAGADVEAVQHIRDGDDDHPATAVWYAASWGNNPKLVEFLLKRGANADYCLWAIVWRDDEAMMKLVLKTNPKLNLKGEGETPIFYAARLQRLKTLDLLIEAGADPNIRDDAKGRTAIEIAIARKLPRQTISRLERLAAGKRGSGKRARA